MAALAGAHPIRVLHSPCTGNRFSPRRSAGSNPSNPNPIQHRCDVMCFFERRHFNAIWRRANRTCSSSKPARFMCAETSAKLPSCQSPRRPSMLYAAVQARATRALSPHAFRSAAALESASSFLLILTGVE
jgi:hypothetical protein